MCMMQVIGNCSWKIAAHCIYYMYAWTFYIQAVKKRLCRSIHTQATHRETPDDNLTHTESLSRYRDGYSVYSIRCVARIMLLHVRYTCIRRGLFDELASRKVRHSDVLCNEDKVCGDKVQSSVKLVFCTVRGTSRHSFQDCGDKVKIEVAALRTILERKILFGEKREGDDPIAG